MVKWFQVEHAGVTHIAVHGRTRDQRNEKPDWDAIALCKSAVKVPVYAHGGCNSYEQALEMAKVTGADGRVSIPYLVSV